MIFIRSIFAIIAFSTFTASQEFSRFSIQSAFFPFSISDYNYNMTETNLPSLELGLRIKPIRKVGIDLLIGGNYNSGHEADSVNDQAKVPPHYIFSGKLGLNYNLFSNERATLGIVLNTGALVEKRTIYNYYIDTKDYSYLAVTPYEFLGLEPSIELTKNFVFYTRFGVEIKFNPNTKEYLNMVGTDHINTKIEHKDSNATVALGGFCIGIRFQF
jgi:hypothetical protein